MAASAPPLDQPPLMLPEPAPPATALQRAARMDVGNRTDRLLRTPLLFETLEPRVLLSGDPITAAAQTAILSGLQSFQTWTANNLSHAAQVVQQLPVISTSVGHLVDLPSQVQTLLVQPATAYFASTATPTIEGLAAAIQADPGTAGSVLGSAFAHGELLITLSAFKTSTPISAPLNLAEDTAGISLQVGTPPDPVRPGNNDDEPGVRLRSRRRRHRQHHAHLLHPARQHHPGRQPRRRRLQHHRDTGRRRRHGHRRIGHAQCHCDGQPA